MLRHMLFAGLLCLSAAAAAAPAPAEGPLEVIVLPAGTGDPKAVSLDYGAPALSILKVRYRELHVFDARGAERIELPVAAALAGFRGTQTVLFALPSVPGPSAPVTIRVEAKGEGAERLKYALRPMDEALADAAGQSRMIALTFGALMAMAFAALLISFVLPDRLFVLYFTLFSLQALYIAYLSGQGFDWPLLRAALPLEAHAWNVPAAFSGAAACLFVRDIADLRRYSPRVYRIFGWLALTFVVLAFANFARLIGLGTVVASIGNVIFLGTAVFTLIVAFRAWRRGTRAAGWFLLAWGLLEVMTIGTTAGFLVGNADPFLHYGLPLSMVTAAILVALGVADRLREQRRALSDAERRAQTDPLTGVLNRRSLIERLDAACMRAQARDLPIALLFIDLDHFKVINDTRGHIAGDACLRAIISPIQEELRHSDVIGRYGGEEFVVILSSADAHAAQATAQRIRERVAELEVRGYGAPIHLTCSIGVASSDTLGVWGEELVASADAAVYVAKSAGRNQVHLAAA